MMVGPGKSVGIGDRDLCDLTPYPSPSSTGLNFTPTRVADSTRSGRMMRTMDRMPTTPNRGYLAPLSSINAGRYPRLEMVTYFSPSEVR
jgi:hypothetical protein